MKRLPLIAVILFSASACNTGLRPPLAPFYESVELDPATTEVRFDVAYRTDDGAHAEKHRLDLYLPRGRGWPMLAFVHGGSLENGDSADCVVGHDIYRNIGRFYARHGIGVALINYRLQPEVNWIDQAGDVATAAAWISRRLEEWGGDGRLYVSGHSAGGWLVSQVALNRSLQYRHGVDADSITEVISVSGSGFDLTDERTWELLGGEEPWRRRFSLEPGDPHWKERASLIPHLDEGAPPFRLFYASDESPALVRQNRLMCEALESTGAECRIEEVEDMGHRRMLLAMSHPNKPLAPRILAALGVSGPTMASLEQKLEDRLLSRWMPDQRAVVRGHVQGIGGQRLDFLR